MTHDGDNADDDGLKALRSVWLSMPDEDPPDRGFAELLAAARVKAEEMAKPSLWHRIAATLRRPPVLALATLVIVLGGAALIGRHSDKGEVAAPTVSSPPAETTVAPPAAPADEAEAPARAVAPAAPEPAPAPEAAPAASLPPPPREPPKHKAATRAPEPETIVTGGLASDSNAKADAVSSDRSVQQQQLALPNGLASSVIQLHEQAREAAARGDCDGARRTTSKIAAIDPRYYQQKVANDSKLAVCAKKN